MTHMELHPPKQTWNLKMDPWKRRFLLETIIFRFHVNFLGCIKNHHKIAQNCHDPLFFTHHCLRPEKIRVESSWPLWGAFRHGVNFCLRAVSPWCLVTCSLGTKPPSSRPKRCLSKRIFPPKNSLNSGLEITHPETNIAPEKWVVKGEDPASFLGAKKSQFSGASPLVF